jgi:hypothetical protein
MQMRWRLSTKLFVVVLLACLILWVFLTMPGVNGRNALRLYVGITEEKTEQILASPGTLVSEDSDRGVYVKTWEADQTKITVMFSADNKRLLDAGLKRQFVNHEEQVPLISNPWRGQLSAAQRIAIWLGLPALPNN